MEPKEQSNIDHVDERNHNFFMVDNEIIDDYKLSVDADSIYMLIIRRAQHKKTCYPSIRRWMKEKHRGHDKAKNAVKELTEKKLIKIDGRKYPNGPFIYRILPVKKGVSRVGTPEIKGIIKANGVPVNQRGVPGAGTGGVSTVGTEKDKVNKTIKKKEKPVVSLPLLLTDEFKSIIEDFNETAGTKFIPDKTLIKLWTSAKKNWDVDYLSCAIHNYALSSWHRKKFLAGKNSWSLKKLLRNRDDEIPKFYEQDPPKEEGTGYQKLDLENSPDMAEGEMDKILRGGK